eukprot:CAMPEP_0174696162 /NCGR_PEP_ID=MMETSP1094-20130205/2383_1 /TAXON_ID=156173 /ORGANISM="Chrysochromulina brevifilum, Strain UTEX LB 985" /LENGTH=159 /DNA_ID=CAMNT_0015892873 /DNA_START=717 /DNA_END=1196 /DNA_ORIENTATION=+
MDELHLPVNDLYLPVNELHLQAAAAWRERAVGGAAEDFHRAAAGTREHVVNSEEWQGRLGHTVQCGHLLDQRSVRRTCCTRLCRQRQDVDAATMRVTVMQIQDRRPTTVSSKPNERRIRLACQQQHEAWSARWRQATVRKVPEAGLGTDGAAQVPSRWC